MILDTPPDDCAGNPYRPCCKCGKTGGFFRYFKSYRSGRTVRKSECVTCLKPAEASWYQNRKFKRKMLVESIKTSFYHKSLLSWDFGGNYGREIEAERTLTRLGVQSTRSEAKHIRQILCNVSKQGFTGEG